jgi:cysteinyl-tRNA synthetase
VFETVRLYNQLVPVGAKKKGPIGTISQLFFDFIREFGQPMALFQEEPTAFLHTLDDILLREKGLERVKIDALVTARVAARKDKNFAESDRLRDELKDLGIEIRDTADGTTWEVRKGQ